MIQNSMQQIFLAVYGVSAGVLVSAGIFTVLLAVGLTPRFIGKTHTAQKIFLYENCITAGAVIGTLFTIVPILRHTGSYIRQQLLFMDAGEWLLYAVNLSGEILLGIGGLFMGMFVGCLALAIAEMLDSIPIFARRTAYRHGLGAALSAVAAGKCLGSLYYFWQGEIFPG